MTACYPTGTDPLGFLSSGAMTLLLGGPGTGKTCLALLAAAELSRCGWSTVFVDIHGCVDPDLMLALGVPVGHEAFTHYQTQTLQEVKDVVTTSIDQRHFIVLDGVEAIEDLKNPDSFIPRTLTMWTRLRASNSTLLITVSSRDHPLALMREASKMVQVGMNGSDRTRSYTTLKDKHGMNHSDQGTFTLPGVDP